MSRQHANVVQTRRRLVASACHVAVPRVHRSHCIALLLFMLATLLAHIGHGAPVQQDDAFVPSMAGICIGCRVARGPDWEFGEQDGGDGSQGTVIELRPWRGHEHDAAILAARVRWDWDGSVNAYRWSVAGHPRDVRIVGKVDVASPAFRAAANGSMEHDVVLQYMAREAASALDVSILRQVYQHWRGHAWTSSRGWANHSTPDPCLYRWEGVACRAGAIIGLELSNNNVAGTLPDVLFRLTRLESLNLSHNRLSGALSPNICNLHELRFLALHANALHGALPPCLAQLRKLEVLMLHTNALEGVLPPLLLRSSTLRVLMMHANVALQLDEAGAAAAAAATIPTLYVRLARYGACMHMRVRAHAHAHCCKVGAAVERCLCCFELGARVLQELAAAVSRAAGIRFSTPTPSPSCTPRRRMRVRVAAIEAAGLPSTSERGATPTGRPTAPRAGP